MVGEEQGWILECFRPCCFYEYSWSTKETIRSLQSKVERLSTFALACFPEALEPMLLTRHSDKARSNVLVHSPLLVSKKEMSVGSVSRVCHVISTWQIPPREGGRPDCFYRKIKPTERVPQNQKNPKSENQPPENIRTKSRKHKFQKNIKKETLKINFVLNHFHLFEVW